MNDTPIWTNQEYLVATLISVFRQNGSLDDAKRMIFDFLFLARVKMIPGEKLDEDIRKTLEHLLRWKEYRAKAQELMDCYWTDPTRFN